MNDVATEPREDAEIALEYELDAAPEKVWRVMTGRKLRAPISIAFCAM